MTLSEKTKLPLGLVLSLVSALVVLAGSAAVAQFRIGDTAQRVDVIDTSVRVHDVEQAGQRVLLQQLVKSVDRIERGIDRLGKDNQNSRDRDRDRERQNK